MSSINQVTNVTEQELDVLQTISIQTFTETFSEHNTAEDMQKYVEENLSTKKLQKEFATAGSSFYLIWHETELAGYMKLNTGSAHTVADKPGTIEIERIYVLRKFHGQQLGKALLQHAINLAKSGAHATIWLGVWEHNSKAIAFYERNGFVRTGAHDFVLGSDVQTDYIMELTLN